MFPLIAEHEEWCRKDKCANKQCQAILEYRSRKEFKFKDSATIQVCDDICYEMFRLQQALKPAFNNDDKSGASQDKSQVNGAEMEQLKMLQEQEGYREDWVQKSTNKINYLQALSFFNDYFQEQEDEEIR